MEDMTAGTGRREKDPSTLPWVEKYRPEDLSDLVAQGDIINTITRLMDAGRLPHLLLYGPPGTGKTSTVLALAKRMYGPKWRSMTLELNASDDRGINVVREQIKSFAETRKLFSTGIKLVILDEADAMTNDAQFALRRVIEKYSRTTRFALICNYVSKIIPALQSRCTRFRFAPLSSIDVASRLDYVIDKEGIGDRVTEDGKKAVLRLANGDMRKVLNVLQATASGFPVVNEEAAYVCTGNPKPGDVKDIWTKLMKCSDLNETYTFLLEQCSTKGLALVDLLTELSKRVTALNLPQPEVKAVLYEKLADIEYRLAFGTSEKIQTASLVGAFELARQVMTKAASATSAPGGR